jgi:DNA-directed RNA polymerase specialized sigma24 family protein
MFGTSDRDLFGQCLNGDWRSRVELYRKFIHANSRLRRLGASYPDINDFLHDCFTNILRTGHSLDSEGSIGDWVESVAVWTALERERPRGVDGLGGRDFVRMCAATEGDAPVGRAAFVSYVPRRSGPEDSLSSRIRALVGEPQNTLLRMRAIENNTWEDAAAAAGRQVVTIGPILVRAVDRLSRFFGAPPTLNDDLEPVFPDVSPEDAAAGKTSQSKPAGRVISMQLDPLFYAVTPEMRRIGLTVPAEVRTIALWDAAIISATSGKTLRDHLDHCHYCSDVLRSLRLMQQALLSEANVDFALCPSASTLLQDPDGAEDPLSQHLLECALCRDERTRALSGDVQPGVTAGTGFGKKIAWVAAAVVILGGVSFYFATRDHKAFVVAETVPELPLMNVNGKYASLAERVAIDDNRVMDSVLYPNQFIFIEARDHLRRGKMAEAMLLAQQLVNAYHDPGGQLLYAECVYSLSVGEGYREMQKAEAMPPRDSYRCWVTLQLALRAGDKATVEREVRHLSSDPDFGDRAENILAQMRAIK